MVRVLAVPNEKSLGAVFAPGVAATVTVVASLDRWFKMAVTVVEPPFSAIGVAINANATVGARSLSVRVRATPVTVPTPWLLLAVPVRVTIRFGSSRVLSTALIVAVSELFAVLPVQLRGDRC